MWLRGGIVANSGSLGMCLAESEGTCNSTFKLLCCDWQLLHSQAAPPAVGGGILSN